MHHLLLQFSVEFHGRFFFIALHGKIYRKQREYTASFFCFSKKRLGEVKNVQLLDVLIHSTIVKAQLLAYFFLNFPHWPQINGWCTRTLTIRYNNKDRFYISWSTVLFHHHFMGTDIKKSCLRWKLLPVFVPSQNLLGKTLTPKIERKGEGGLVG